MRTFLFDAGNILIDEVVENECAHDLIFDRFCLHSFGRHLNGDWGDIADDKGKENDENLDNKDGLITSEYIFHEGSDVILRIETNMKGNETRMSFRA